MDEAQLRREIERELRAEIEAELRAETEEKHRKAELDAAFSPAIQSANRERAWERQGANSAAVTDAAQILGAALAEQMIAGLPGTTLDSDGLGDGTT